jgi:hypothetical protein
MNDDGLDIPEFLRISTERRRQAWERWSREHPTGSAMTFKRRETEVERAYRISKDRDKAFRQATTKYVENKNSYFAKRKAENAEKKAVKDAAAVAAKENRRTFRKRRDHVSADN